MIITSSAGTFFPAEGAGDGRPAISTINNNGDVGHNAITKDNGRNKVLVLSRDISGGAREGDRAELSNVIQSTCSRTLIHTYITYTRPSRAGARGTSIPINGASCARARAYLPDF